MNENITFTINMKDFASLVASEILRQTNLVKQEPEQKAEPKMLYSIKELADFLQCSTVTAQKIKNSGRIPYSQTGRKVVFDGNEVLRALSKNKIVI